MRRSYWKGNVVADVDTATAVSVVPIGKHWPEFVFQLPAEKNEFDKLLRVIQIAAASGDYQARADVRKALGL
jgi:hypothetical protein